MSANLYTSAYETRLGNLTAKDVLVKLCDEANAGGLGWPSVGLIARHTEITKRTVDRVLQVFELIGLIEWKRVTVNDRYGVREVDAYQIDLDKLGTDLTECYWHAFAEAQGKQAVFVRGKWSLRDSKNPAAGRVSETQPQVSETQECVSETKPPDPHIGRPVIDPFLDPPPENACADPEKLTPEQQEHLDRLAAEGKGEPSFLSWRCHYEDENRKAAKVRTEAAVQAARDVELRRLYVDAETGLATMRRRCGFAWSEGDELGPVLRQVVADQAEMGKPFWRTLAQMEEAWELQRRQGAKLRARYGPLKFFRDGHWIDPSGWHWNVEQLRLDDGASAGSAR